MQDPPATAADDTNPRRQRRAIVVLDVVESVRLLQQHESATIERWRRFVDLVRRTALPACGGRLVKSLGDGMLLEFAEVPRALTACWQAQRLLEPINDGLPEGERIRLRLGGHVAEVVVDDLDIFGAGVNLAARLATLAAPDEMVVSAAFAGSAVAGLDADFEDMGLCYLKHIEAPVPALRAWPPQRVAAPTLLPEPAAPTRRTAADTPFDLRPMLAVLPFAGAGELTLGDLLSDSLIVRLSGSDRMRVSSRLSTQALRGRVMAMTEIGHLLGAQFVVSGAFTVGGTRFVASIELAEVRSGEVLWGERVSGAAAELLAVDDPHSARLAEGIIGAIAEAGLRRVRTMPLPSLEGFALQFGAASLMHHPVPADFHRSRALLEHLAERHPRAPTPRAWLAKWFVLRGIRGLVEAGSSEAPLALDHARRAVDLDPDNGFALAMEAFVHCHLRRDLGAAEQALTQALQASPNEAMAWLVRCVVEGFRGDGEEAWKSAQRALELSPLDPLRHFFDGLAASAAVAAHRLDDAILLARRSLRSNRNDLPTLRALAVALAENGALAEAAAAGRRIVELDPGFTLKDYVARSPAGAEATRRRYADAMRAAGLPAG